LEYLQWPLIMRYNGSSGRQSLDLAVDKLSTSFLVADGRNHAR
jgi:hypothetical protein